jgi:hypothetical protein
VQSKLHIKNIILRHRQIRLVGLGEATAITVIYAIPTVIIFGYLIPETIGLMSVLMSARDLSLATPEEKRTLVSKYQ